MQVPLLDLKAQYQTIKDECLQVTKEIYESQYFILGPYVEKLEKEIADYCSAKYAVAPACWQRDRSRSLGFPDK